MSGSSGVGGGSGGDGGAADGGGGAGAAGAGEAGSGGVCLSQGPGAHAYGIESEACFTSDDCTPFSSHCLSDTEVRFIAKVCAGNSCDYSFNNFVVICAAGETCQEGACRPPCTQDADCGEPRSWCFGDTPETDRPRCENGACKLTVETSSCSTGERCYRGECVALRADGTPQVACVTALDCTIPHGLCTCATTMHAYAEPSCEQGLCAWKGYDAYCGTSCYDGFCHQGLP